MHRFYVDQKISHDTLHISDAEQLHHIRDVLRRKVDDEVTVFDNEGNEYTCVITALGRKQATLTIKTRKPAKRSKIKVAIACAIPKKAKMDDIIDKLTQLGVDEIIPLETERVIVKPAEDKKEARLERWKKIAQSAAEQSQRTSVPDIEPVTSLKSLLAASQAYNLKLIPTVSGTRKHLKEVLAGARPENILVLIGPEGDFTQREIELAKNAGFIPVSLGDSILRVETAAIAVASYIRFSLFD